MRRRIVTELRWVRHPTYFGAVGRDASGNRLLAIEAERLNVKVQVAG